MIKYLFYEPFVFLLLVLASCQSSVNMVPIKQQKSSITKTSDGSVKDEYSISIVDIERYMELCGRNVKHLISPYLMGRDTCLFIVQADSEWTVFSGDRRVNPIIAKGNGVLNMNSTDEYVCVLNEMAKSICDVKHGGGFVDENALDLWEIISPRIRKKEPTKAGQEKWVIRKFMVNSQMYVEKVVPHLISTRWGQDTPWNDKFPIDYSVSSGSSIHRCKTGCVAVAVAQMFYYLHYNSANGEPSRLYTDVSYNPFIYGETSDIGFSKNKYTNDPQRWNEMALTKEGPGNFKYVGDLMMEIGNSFGMTYSALGSGALMQNAGALRQFGLTCSSSTYNVGLLIKELDKQKPVIITGYSEKTGHCWIIDGYRREKTEYEMVCYCEYTSDWISTDEVFDTFEQASRKYGFESAEDIRPYPNQVKVEYYLLMNWGDDGRGSGSSYTSLAPWYFAKKKYDRDFTLFYDFR